VRKLGTHHPERSLKQISERIVFDHLIYLRDKGTSSTRAETYSSVLYATLLCPLVTDY
jgi:hypothetical protein